jgi:hypothetical protein
VHFHFALLFKLRDAAMLIAERERTDLGRRQAAVSCEPALPAWPAGAAYYADQGPAFQGRNGVLEGRFAQLGMILV